MHYIVFLGVGDKGVYCRCNLRLESVILMLCILLLGVSEQSILVNGEMEGWAVDVYTQKVPYGGVGWGEPSDSFAPQKAVVLYANVTYNLVAVKNVPVSFVVLGPSNTVQNYSLSFSAWTDTSGRAETNFTLPWPSENPETTIFGIWKVFAYAKNASDHLIFHVGWTVDLVSINVFEEDPPQGGWIQVQVSLETLSLTSRNATLAFISFDSLGKIISTLITKEIRVSPEGTNFTTKLTIPHWATPGIASVNVSAYTPNGDPYSPTVLSTTFYISLLGDLNGDFQVNMRDLGIASLAYGSHQGHQRWNPLADLNKDYKVNMRDIAILTKNFGRSHP